MKYTKMTTWFLAVAMFMFGILKFVNPFKAWYSVQIENSGLGQTAYVMGIVGEITVGVVLLGCLIYKQQLGKKWYDLVTTMALITIIIMMLTSAYVHGHPNVAADVLPLKIKPPYIPAFIIIIAGTIIYVTVRSRKTTAPKNRD